MSRAVAIAKLSPTISEAAALVTVPVRVAITCDGPFPVLPCCAQRAEYPSIATAAALEKQKCSDYAFEKYSCHNALVIVRVHPMIFKSIVLYCTFQKCSFYTLQKHSLNYTF